jgi:hypothetical protein
MARPPKYSSAMVGISCKVPVDVADEIHVTAIEEARIKRQDSDSSEVIRRAIDYGLPRARLGPDDCDRMRDYINAKLDANSDSLDNYHEIVFAAFIAAHKETGEWLVAKLDVLKCKAEITGLKAEMAEMDAYIKGCRDTTNYILNAFDDDLKEMVFRECGFEFPTDK